MRIFAGFPREGHQLSNDCKCVMHGLLTVNFNMCN